MIEKKFDEKPTKIKILAVLWIVIGLSFLAITITSGYLVNQELENMEEQREGLQPIMGTGSQDNYFFILGFVMMAIFFISLATIAFLLGYFSLKRKNWAWTIGIIFSSLSSFLIGFHLISDFGFGIPIFNLQFLNLEHSIPWSIYGGSLLIISLVLLYILTKPDIKLYFRKK